MLQNGKEYLHPEVFEAVYAKWDALCQKNSNTPAERLWSPAVRMVRIEQQMATLQFIRDFGIMGYL